MQFLPLFQFVLIRIFQSRAQFSIILQKNILPELVRKEAFCFIQLYPKEGNQVSKRGSIVESGEKSRINFIENKTIVAGDDVTREV